MYQKHIGLQDRSMNPFLSFAFICIGLRYHCVIAIGINMLNFQSIWRVRHRLYGWHL